MAEVAVSFDVPGEAAAALERLGPEVVSERLRRALFDIVAKAEGAAAGAPVAGEGGRAVVWKRAIIAKKKAKAAEPVEDQEERYVLGVVMEPDEEDTHGETETAEDIRKAAFRWMENYRSGGDEGHLGLMHKQVVDGKVAVLESYIQKSDETVGEETVKAGSWVMAVRVIDDELWADVKTGDLTGFSIGGTAVRKPNN